MNQNDYKKIAEIIKKRLTLGTPEVLVISLKQLSIELADYFQEEQELKTCYQLRNGGIFIKSQFLKDCGVQE